MKRVILDTNIYGMLVLDLDIPVFKVLFMTSKDVIVYGLSIIRKELRNTSKRKTIGKENLRIQLLELYDLATKDRTFFLTPDIEHLADKYYDAYRSFGGKKSKSELCNDFLVVAAAVIHDLDVVVSQDSATLTSEVSLKAYSHVNELLKLKNPSFINYDKFRRLFAL